MAFEQKWACFAAALTIITLIVMFITNRTLYHTSSNKTPTRPTFLISVIVLLIPGWIALILTAPPMFERPMKYAGAIVLLIGYPAAFLWQRKYMARTQAEPAESLAPENRLWRGAHQHLPIKPWMVLVIVALGLFMLVSTYLRHG